MSTKADYGFGARVLHHFALTSRMVSEMSFQIEQGLYPTSSKKAREGEHVFVTALARAGTTALMRLLYETGEFCSLTYREMPFPLAPRLWRKISSTSAQKGELSERAHGDGILVDFDSPEALEEVFWRVFSGKSYIASDRLTPMKAAPETIEAFRKYIADLLELSGARRYLSKNNNNILRLSSLHTAFPRAVILIPFRDPLQQALSLYRQHRHFVEVHREDNFSKQYMKWLVHHEFGSDHRRFDVDGKVPTYAPEKLDYWLEQWNRVYRYLLKQSKIVKGQALFVEYEGLCDEPQVVWKSLARHTGLRENLPSGFSLSKAPAREAEGFDAELRAEAYKIHGDLKECFKNTIL